MSVACLRWVVMCAMYAAVQAAAGDIVVRQDGSMLEGKVVTRDAKGLSFRTDDPKSPQTLQMAASEVERVLEIDAQGAVVKEGIGTALPAKRAAAHFEIPREPVGPPVAVATGASYCMIPLHGVVGETIRFDALEKSLADAQKRKPSVVVLDIDSPGGRVAEAEAMMKVLHRYNKDLRIVVLADQNLSAAAITSLSVKEIFVKSTSTTGAATAYDPVNLDLPADIREKMQSAWRAVARNSAEEGGHDPLLAEAMIDSSRELHLDTIDGKKVVKEGPGEEILCRKGRILTLTSHEAVNCGLANGIADDLDELGESLKLKGWREVKCLGPEMADYLTVRWESYSKQTKELEGALMANLLAVRSSMPQDDALSQRIIMLNPGGSMGRGAGGAGGGFGPPAPIGPAIPGGRGGRGGIGGGGFGGGGFGGPTMPQTIIVTSGISPQMRSQWKQRALATVVALQKMEQNARDEMELAQAFGEKTLAEEIKDALPELAGARSQVYAIRNRYANDTPPAPPVAGPVAPAGPATTRPAGLNVAASAAPALNLKYAPLSTAWSDFIKEAVSKKKTNTLRPAGYMTGAEYQDSSPDGVLIGLRVGMGKRSGREVITSLQPVYLTSKGVLAGALQGKADSTPVIDLIAKEGYAVVGAKMDGSPALMTLVLQYARITPEGLLDPSDTYDSPVIGNEKSGRALSNTTAVVGISGRFDGSAALGLELIVAPATTPLILTKGVLASLKQAVDAKSYQASPIAGGINANNGFTDVTAQGVLIGMRCGVSKVNNADSIVSVQPVYLTSKGPVMGPLRGTTTASRYVELTAREGYVVAMAKVNGSDRLEGLQFTFAQLVNGKVVTPQYDSAIIGTLGRTPTIQSSKTAIMGISGKTGTAGLAGLGMVNLPLN